MPDQTAPAALPQKTVYRQLPTRSPELAGLPPLAEISRLVQQWETEDPGFRRALESGLLPVDALGQLGIRLCLADRNADAASVLSAAVALSPDDINLLNNLAVALDRTAQGERAIAVVERSLELSNNQINSWIFLGNLKAGLNDLTGARAAYESAVAHDPESHLAWQQLGLALKDQRQHQPAIECFLTCVKLGQSTPEILAILGQLFYLTGQFKKSRDAYQFATGEDASNAMYQKMLGELRFLCVAIDNGDIDGLIPSADADDLLHKSFSLLSAYGYTDAAKRIAERRVKLFPSSPTGAYLLHAIHGDAAVTRSPDEFLIECFDDVAERFDAHLLDGLGYDIPQKLAAGLTAFIPGDAKFRVLDAGCGTGLCGPWIRGFSNSLTGVDLSPKMLEQARKRKIYDQLVCAELTSFLAGTLEPFDIIIAADVVIYFGDLCALGSAIASSLRTGALVAFSTERALTPGHHLLASGRFAHHPEYIRSVFATDFVECLCENTVVRHEANQPVDGNLFIFQRR